MNGLQLADLHRHLDGSLRLATLQELAAELGVSLPDSIYFYRGMGLSEALNRFAITLAVLQSADNVRRVAAEMCEDAMSEGVSTLEIRFAPQLHRESDLQSVVDAAAEGIGGRAGLILCGLYGEPPDVLASLVEAARRQPAVVAIDLAGGPQSGDSWSMSDYAEAFRAARELGIGRTVHAGEGRPAAEIATAIEVLGADRIGHGTTLLDDPRVVELVLNRGVTIEACPTSNLQTGAIPTFEAHPVVTWLEVGIRVCVNTDNTLFSQVDAPTEYERVRQLDGMSDRLFERLIQNGHSGAYARR